MVSLWFEQFPQLPRCFTSAKWRVQDCNWASQKHDLQLQCLVNQKIVPPTFSSSNAFVHWTEGALLQSATVESGNRIDRYLGRIQHWTLKWCISVPISYAYHALSVYKNHFRCCRLGLIVILREWVMRQNASVPNPPSQTSNGLCAVCSCSAGGRCEEARATQHWTSQDKLLGKEKEKETSLVVDCRVLLHAFFPPTSIVCLFPWPGLVSEQQSWLVPQIG